jgi:hypothetical protein
VLLAVDREDAVAAHRHDRVADAVVVVQRASASPATMTTA